MGDDRARLASLTGSWAGRPCWGLVAVLGDAHSGVDAIKGLLPPPPPTSAVRTRRRRRCKAYQEGALWWSVGDHMKSCLLKGWPICCIWYMAAAGDQQPAASRLPVVVAVLLRAIRSSSLGNQSGHHNATFVKAL